MTNSSNPPDAGSKQPPLQKAFRDRLPPLVAVCFFPAGLAALSMVSSPKERNIMVSLTVPIAFLVGGGASPTLIGFIGDVSSFGPGIALVGGLIMAGSIFSGHIKFYN